MESKRKNPDEIAPDKTDRDQTLKEHLNMEINIDDLLFVEEKNSYEMDVESDDPDYVHLDPYDTAVKNGGDALSDFDEANPTAVNEYDKDASLESDLNEMGMHVETEKETSRRDEELSRTPEDWRDDLDEEGYPKNDRR